jgi:hypothetical protein
MYRVNAGISFGDENYEPGDVVSLAAWPKDALEQLVKEQAVTPVGVVNGPPAPPSARPGADENKMVPPPEAIKTKRSR